MSEGRKAGRGEGGGARSSLPPSPFPFPTLLVPEEVLRIVRTLESAGHETWCVGGAVRDNLAGEPNADFDLATAARPDEVRRLFRRTVPVGIEHGTVAVLDPAGRPHEVTTFRRDVKTDGRHAEVEFGVSLDEDLARRDFTFNAIAYHPLHREWRDPFDGRGDLGRRLVRAVGDAERRFREDYLRILRGLRFAARFDAAIDPPTWEAMRRGAEGLRHLSAERVREEWFKGLTQSRSRDRLIRGWEEVGAMTVWLPELDVKPVDHLPVDPVLITAVLSHEPGSTLERLRCSRAEIERGWGIRAGLEVAPPDPSDGPALRRYLAALGDRADDVLAVRGDERLREAARAVQASGAPLRVRDLAVSGHDLTARGLSGPAVGETLRRLLEEVLEDPARNTREYLLSRV